MHRSLAVTIALALFGCSALLDLGGLTNGGGDGGDAGPQTAPDAGPDPDAGRADGGADGGVDGGVDGGERDGGERDGGTDGGPLDGGPEPLGPGLVLTGAGSGATVRAEALAADATQLCVGGTLSGGSAEVGGVLLTPSSGDTPWVACYDLTPEGPSRRYVRTLTTTGPANCTAVALDASGRLYAVGRIAPMGMRSFDGHTVDGRSFAVRLSREGDVTAAVAFSPESEYPTSAAVQGTTLYTNVVDSFGNSAAVSRIDLTTFTLVTTTYLTTGWHSDLHVPGDGIVAAIGEVGGVAVVHRTPPELTPARWTRASVGRGASLAARLTADGSAFVAGNAIGTFQWVGSTRMAPGTDPAPDVVVTRFDADGEPAWVTRPIASLGEDQPVFLALDATGAPIVGGFSEALDAPSGLETLPSSGGTKEGWIVRLDPGTGAPAAWERIRCTGDLLTHRGVVQDGWLYVAGSFTGSVRAASSDALGPSGLTAMGVRDAFVARFPIP